MVWSPVVLPVVHRLYWVEDEEGNGGEVREGVIFALLVFLCPVYEKWRPPPLESALLLVFEGERC